MKRSIAAVLVVILALAITGCKRSNKNIYNSDNKIPSLRSEEEIEFEGDVLTELTDATEADESFLPEAPSLRSEEEKETSVNTTVPQLKSEPIPEDDAVLSGASEYTALIHDLKNIVQYRLRSGYSMGDNPPVSEATQSAISFNSENEYKWDGMIGDLLGYPEADSLDCFGYILHDLNVDGKPELFFVRKDHSIVAVFTVYNGKVVLLDAYWSRYRGYISETGGLYTKGSGGAAYTTIDFLEISEGKIFSKFSYYSDVDSYDNPCYFTEENGVSSRITKEEFYGVLEWNENHDKSFWNSLPVQPLY